jgi:TonB family protein
MKALLYVIVFGVISTAALGQEPSPPQLYTMTGTIQDPSGAAIAGLRVTATKATTVRFATTDINGDFHVQLTVGDHILTIEPIGLYDFRAFIKITETGPNPDKVQFTVDPSRVCCVAQSGQAFAKPTSLPKPAYPPAARAVRATGEVIIRVKVGSDGKVLLAEPENGHVLLRAAARAAAQGSRFEPSETTGREVRITYVFDIGDMTLREGVRRYTNAFRVDVVAVSEIY